MVDTPKTPAANNLPQEKVKLSTVEVLSSWSKSEGFMKGLRDKLGEKAGSFMTSLISIVQNDNTLAQCNPNDIYTNAIKATVINLPIDKNLGFAWIVPYNNHGKPVAQFQIGWKGYYQLAIRTRRFLKINVTDVREGELVSFDRLTGDMVFNWLSDAERANKKVIGYVCYFKLIDGFEKTYYMSAAEMEAHAERYSQSYRKSHTGLWKDQRQEMAYKTILKMCLKRFAPMSIELEKAIEIDQSDANGDYIDSKPSFTVENAKMGTSQEERDAGIVEGDVVAEPTDSELEQFGA